MKNLFKVLVVFSLFMMVGCSQDQKETSENITLDLEIINVGEDKVLFDDEVTVEGTVSTLEDFLVLAQDKLEIEFEKGGPYGTALIGMLGYKTEDWNKGPWWLYESENNESCKAAGFCEGISSLKVKNGDKFVFKFTN